MFRKMA